MAQFISITSQGQINLPKKIRTSLNISGTTKAEIEIKNGSIIINPRRDFWSLAGSLTSDVKLNDRQLAEARAKFETDWTADL